MSYKYKNFNVTSIYYINEQKNRFKDAYYHPYDHIVNSRLKQKTNNIR